ncbi:hypothetical protein P170DRAFT_475343 [Aspergillus steynii IBT 23096]|uniref:Uncharacterized protein n=1 Tax=Aspergillus steynii IBT 23096 TaxID=1392250 RepID=A0A2I2G822_9EURO|nr:uncharacterized protein P170DRAFT_475343 [Aspergillus steynii IBT 23096]PLB49015.1 hypothetical protein P170DRAFT_475343 [Aspergillus steynii IBT 23096]
MPRNVARESINELWKKVFVTNDIVYSEDPATMKEVDNEDLSRHGIARIPFELETAAVGLMPSFLFKPLDLTDVREHRPSEESLEAAQFIDYATHTNPEVRRDQVCGSGLAAQLAYNLVTQWALCTAEQGLVVPVNVSIPNPFFYLFDGFFRYPSRQGSSTAAMTLEPAWENNRPVYPHVIITTTHNFSGNDDSMLWGELAPLVEAVYSRANQPLVTDMEEMERLDTKGARDFPGKPRAFGGEKKFPDLMLSFLNNQHGRVFYAHMEERQLMVYQSRLYSFQTRDDATVELFVQFLLSSPLSVPVS